MNLLKSIMEKFETDVTLFTQEDYDEIEAISENIVKFLDENPEINRESFMMGFTLANVITVTGMMKEYKNNPVLSSEKEVNSSAPEEVNYDDEDDFELKEGENAWPLRG